MAKEYCSDTLSQAIQYIKNRTDVFIKELKELCSFQSISGNTIELEASADWLVRKLQDLGADTKILSDTGDTPIVFGEIIGESNQTLLIYNYYDVVSEGDLKSWRSSPFIPEIRNGRFYARGADSNKGNLLSRIHAVEAILRGARRRPPVTVKFLLEGEEESGSPQLPNVFKKHSKLLACDGCIWAGERRDDKGRFQIALGTKGLLYLELSVVAKRSDMHSSFATVVSNPAIELISALNGMVDTTGLCKLEGFYTPVKEPSEEERHLLSNMSLNKGQFGSAQNLYSSLVNKTDNELLVHHLYEPSCTISGLYAGHTGDGMKTVLPNKAVAKVDFRLVPDQRVDQVIDQISRYLDERVNGRCDINILAAMDPSKTPYSSSLVKTAVTAAKETSDIEPVIFPTSPVSGYAGLVHSHLRAPTIAVGVGDHQSNPHGPNESIAVDSYVGGVRFMAALLERFTDA